jgi:uncharacterized protein YjbJ (UPF0337 family)
MGFLAKIRNRMQRGQGRAKERAGRESGDPYLEAEGRKDRLAGGAKQFGERAKDVAKEARRTTRR